MMKVDPWDVEGKLINRCGTCKWLCIECPGEPDNQDSWECKDYKRKEKEMDEHFTMAECVDRQTDYCVAAEGGYDCSQHENCKGCPYESEGGR